ncbi:MAG: hypothetical protein LC750_04520 [Actinobacteria bacterium]|nr:hypothetical protein [Actinomycetota bacterium]
MSSSVSFAVPRRWGWVLVGSGVWTYWVWITRIVNIAKQDQTTQFKVAHFVLAGGSLAFATAVGVIGTRLLRGTR